MQVELMTTDELFTRFFRVFIVSDTATGENVGKTYAATIRYCDALVSRGYDRELLHVAAKAELATARRIAAYPLVAPECPCGQPKGIRARRKWSTWDQVRCQRCGREGQCIEGTPNVRFAFGNSQAEREAVASQETPNG